MPKTYVINIIGAPGVGKTTISALLFARLKLRGYICEYVQEYAKKLVWIKDFDSLNNQYHVTKKQYELLHQIDGHVNFIVTDGPLIHGIYYNKYNKDNISNIDKISPSLIYTTSACFVEPLYSNLCSRTIVDISVISGISNSSYRLHSQQFLINDI